MLWSLRAVRARRHRVLPSHAAAAVAGRRHGERVGLAVVLPVVATVLLWIHLRGESSAMRFVQRMLLLRWRHGAAAAAAVASAAHADALAAAGVLLGGAVRVMASTVVGAAVVPARVVAQCESISENEDVKSCHRARVKIRFTSA